MWWCLLFWACAEKPGESAAPSGETAETGEAGETGCLSETGAVSGRVFKDELELNPEGNARVHARQTDAEIETLADKGGAYAFTALPVGEWSLDAETSDGDCSTSLGHTLQIKPCSAQELNLIVDACIGR